MSRISAVLPEEAHDDVKVFYNDLQKKIGRVPNIFQNMGNSPAVIKGYIALNDAISKTSLSPELREEIALVVAQTNDCNYCLSAHTTMAGAMGIKAPDIILARKGQANNPKTQAILLFTKSVVEKRAKISDQDVAKLKAAGVTDAELAEIILVITMNMFTNYFNHITDPVVDFPQAPQLN